MNIQLVNPFTKNLLSLAAEGLMENCALIFPKKNGAYRIVSDNNYTENFGFQWNKFAGTQVDKAPNYRSAKHAFLLKPTGIKKTLPGKIF